MSSINIGDAVPLEYTISAAATVTLTITDPDGVTSTPTPSPSGTGPVTYSADVPVDQAGTWLYRFVATGTVVDAEDGQFYVQPNATANVYTTLRELKQALSIRVDDTEDDDDLQDAILVSSRAVEADCQRHFYQTTEVRTFTPQDWWTLKLGPFNDLVTVTTVKTDGDGDGVFEITWQPSDYQLLHDGGSANQAAAPEPRPFTRVKAVGTQAFPIVPCWPGIRDNLIQIEGTWGWPQVPDRIRRATRMMAAEVFKLNSAPFGATGIADLGIIRVRENPKYKQLIAYYRKVEAAVVVL